MAKLSTAGRKKIPTGSFAVVQHQDGKTIKKFPVNDLPRARNALARVANRSPQLKAKVHAKVAAKFPALAKRSEAIKGSAKHNGAVGY
jgi:hypothetical protein